MAARHTVLVVDPLEETQEVLRAALSERQVDVMAAPHAARALALARVRWPSLVVFDVESDGCSAVVAGKLLAESAARGTPLLVIGAARRGSHRVLPRGSLPKPYQYAALIRKIEELLGEVVEGARRRDAKAA